MSKIGIECHIQLETKTKLFCSCPTSGKDIPNSRTCEICAGFPGSKPTLNKEAVNQALKVALALSCKISNEMFFSRKSYFYPDLAKNFQISQYEIPLATLGNLENIKIRRIHLEEDPGRLIHKNTYTLIDYNRSGIPLIEVVTEPDFKSPEEVRLFLNKLTLILEYLNVYSRKNENTARTDANLSVENGQRVEIKNITGIKEVEKALTYELRVQEKEPAKIQQTKAWDAEKQITFLLRTKESEEDYGYIFEPDLTKIEITQEQIKNIKKTLPELADQKISRFIKQYKIPKADAQVIASELILAELFEKIIEKISPTLAAKWVRRELLRVLHYNKKTLEQVKIDEKHMIELLELVESKQITDATAKKLLEQLIEKPFSPKEHVKKQDLKVISTEKDLENHCKQAIKENPQAVNDYKQGKEEALHFITGSVMRKTKGKADPKTVKEILTKLI